MSSEFQERGQRYLKLIKEINQKHPFKNDDIKQFYHNHQGDDDRSSSEFSFIQTRSPFYLDYHLATYNLLLFLDQGYGDVELQIGKSKQTVKLRERTLNVTEVMLLSLKNRRDIDSFTVFQGGLAALSGNVGQGLGADYYEAFKNVGQASLALLEQMPSVYSLQSYNDIKETYVFIIHI